MNRQRRMDRHRHTEKQPPMARPRKKRKQGFLSSRLPTILISIVTSAMMLLGIAIYAESQTSPPEEQIEAPASDVDTQPEPQEPEEPQAPTPPDDEENTSLSESSEAPLITSDEETVLDNTEEPISEPPPEVTPGPEATEEPASTSSPTATNVPGATATPIPTMPPPTENPTLAPTTAPTAAPTADPTAQPTIQPTLAPSAYTLSITGPSGWFRDTAKVKLRVTDMNGTGWQYIQWRINGDGAWVDISHLFASSEYAEVEISEDCTVYLAVISPSGKTVTAEKHIQCFDREIPVVRAAIDGETLRAEGKDNLSGIAAIIVCGHRFTDLKDNVLRIRLRDYADNYAQVSIQSEDKAGNLSEIRTLKNPYYNPNLPTPTPQPTCPPRTPTPTRAPAPTRTPGGGSSGGGGNGGGGSNRATPTPTPEETPSPSGSPEPSETPYSFYIHPTETPLTLEPGTGFTGSGNAIARDLLYDKHTNKQFIHMQARDGSSYYIVIDYDKPLDEAGESYETYFLNVVDARDLFDLVDEQDLPAQYQATPTPMPTDVPMPTPEPTEIPPEATPEPEPTPEPEKSGNMGLMAIVLILAAGGGALWFFKLRKPSGQSKRQNTYEDYDMDDEDDYEDEDEDGED